MANVQTLRALKVYHPEALTSQWWNTSDTLRWVCCVVTQSVIDPLQFAYESHKGLRMPQQLCCALMGHLEMGENTKIETCLWTFYLLLTVWSRQVFRISRYRLWCVGFLTLRPVKIVQCEPNITNIEIIGTCSWFLQALSHLLFCTFLAQHAFANLTVRNVLPRKLWLIPNH